MSFTKTRFVLVSRGIRPNEFRSARLEIGGYFQVAKVEINSCRCQKSRIYLRYLLHFPLNELWYIMHTTLRYGLWPCYLVNPPIYFCEHALQMGFYRSGFQ